MEPQSVLAATTAQMSAVAPTGASAVPNDIAAVEVLVSFENCESFMDGTATMASGPLSVWQERRTHALLAAESEREREQGGGNHHRHRNHDRESRKPRAESMALPVQLIVSAALLGPLCSRCIAGRNACATMFREQLRLPQALDVLRDVWLRIDSAAPLTRFRENLFNHLTSAARTNDAAGTGGTAAELWNPMALSSLLRASAASHATERERMRRTSRATTDELDYENVFDDVIGVAPSNRGGRVTPGQRDAQVTPLPISLFRVGLSPVSAGHAGTAGSACTNSSARPGRDQRRAAPARTRARDWARGGNGARAKTAAIPAKMLSPLTVVVSSCDVHGGGGSERLIVDTAAFEQLEVW